MTKGQGLYLHLSNKDLSSAETALAAIEKFRKSKDKEAENKRVILLANEPVDLTAGQDLEGEYQTFADIGKKCGSSFFVSSQSADLRRYPGTELTRRSTDSNCRRRFTK